MATTFYLRDGDSGISNVGWAGSGDGIVRNLSTERGAGSTTSVTNTVTGPIATRSVASEITKTAGGTHLPGWVSPPLFAVTISGTVTINLRGSESSAMANATLTARVVRASRGGQILSTICAYVTTNAEVGTSDAAVSWTPTVTSTSLGDADRLGILVDIDDGSGVTIATGFTVTFSYDGPTAAAAGDSFITFAEDLTEFFPPFSPRRMPLGA